MLVSNAVIAEGLVKTYGSVRALDGLDLAVPEGTVLGAARAERRRQDDVRPHPDHAARSRTPAGRGRRDRRAAPTARGPQGDRPLRAVRRGRRVPHRLREPRHDRPAVPPRPVQGAGRAPASCSSSSTWPTRPTGRSRPTPAACAAGSTSPARSSPGRRCCSSTSRPPGSTRAAGPTCGRCIAELVAAGTTLLLTTQYLEEADRLADEIVVDRPRPGHRPRHVRRAEGPGRRRARRGRRGRPPAAWATRRECCWPSRATASPSVDEHTRKVSVSRTVACRRPRCWSRRCASSTPTGIAVHDVGLRRPTLDDVFLTLTGHAARGACGRRPELETAGAR